MSDGAFLAKLKGHSRTFVVHSNADPYAAAAAMGAAMGSHRLGPYFNLLHKQSSGAGSQPATVAVPDLAPSEVSISVVRDWAEFLRQKGMAASGLKYDGSRTLEENTMRYLIAHNRRIPITAPRTVHESQELSVPPEYQADYIVLKTVIASGGDLKPYLSRDILKRKRPDRNDGLLNAWGIQHLHLRPEGTGHILLCRITETDVFVVQALPHVHDVWVDASLLRVMHDNWPQEIAAGECRRIRGEAMPSSQRLAMRNQNTNFATAMADGTVYLAPGGGLMASGDCFEDRRDHDEIFSELAHWQGIVEGNAARFRAALSWPPSKELSIKMAFDHRDCWLYEPTTGSTLSLAIQQ
jgi:hypothetical protein